MVQIRRQIGLKRVMSHGELDFLIVGVISVHDVENLLVIDPRVVWLTSYTHNHLVEFG